MIELYELKFCEKQVIMFLILIILAQVNLIFIFIPN